MAASTKSYIVAGIETQKDANATGSTKFYITAGLPKIKTVVAVAAPTGVFYGPLIGPLGGPV